MESLNFFLKKEAGNSYALFSQARLIGLILFIFCFSSNWVQAQGSITIEIEDYPLRLHVNSAEPDSQYVDVYPNPVTTLVHIAPSPGLQLKKLEIVSQSGALVFSTSINGSATHQVNISEGMYFFKIQIDSGAWLSETITIQGEN